ERLGVGQVERGQLRWTPQVDEGGRRLDPPDPLGTGVIVVERGEGAVPVEPPVVAKPGRAPAEARDAEPLEALGERPQLIEVERGGREGDITVAQARASTT